ncbi:MAG: cation-translocating P-type ATPase [Eubacteriaceae bacterium]|jgi:heavy metal translocating P-type ATPase|nr:cation-translocating P-type ATPase [Eubacteriaceae bacterium]
MNTMIHRINSFLEAGGIVKDLSFLILSAIALLFSFLKIHFLPFDPAWVAILLCGLPIMLEAVVGLIGSFDIKADVLVAIALVASIVIGEIFVAGEVAFIMQLGALLEERTVAKSRAGIEKLIALQPMTARKLNAEVIPVENVQVGDYLRVLPGETVPVDGIITSGATSINQSVLTGESLPEDKNIGDSVSSGSLNQYGTFEMEATRVGADSSIQRMVCLVESADTGKAKITHLADRWATWIVVIALLSAVITYLVTGQIIRSVTILVVFCPCALVLATPTAIVAAIGNASKQGFLVREGDALERLGTVDTVAFDKTGTLTTGNLKVAEVVSITPNLSDGDLYRLVAGAEQHSEHPLGQAIVTSYQKEYGQIPEASYFSMQPGLGIAAEVMGQAVLAGNLNWLKDKSVALMPDMLHMSEEAMQMGYTVIYVAVNGQAVGYLTLSDTVRPESKKLISDIQALGYEPVLLTGDHRGVAERIAKPMGFQEIHSDLLPEDKIAKIEQLQSDGHRVAMIGDGINDAPALKTATIGLAMGNIGSDIAVDASDIVLVEDDLAALPHLLNLSKRMMMTIKRNLAFSLGLNFVAIILAMTGILTPFVGALVHNAGSVVVVINAVILLNWQQKHQTKSQTQTEQNYRIA